MITVVGLSRRLMVPGGSVTGARVIPINPVLVLTPVQTPDRHPSPPSPELVVKLLASGVLEPERIRSSICL